MSNAKLPIEIKARRGTLRPSRETPPGSPLQCELPNAPEGLPERVLAEFYRLGEMMLSLGTVTRADQSALIAAAQAIVDHAEACKAITANGSMFVETPTGLKVHPAVRIRAEADKRVRSWLQSLGLTPSDRAKVSAAPPPREKSDLARLLEESS